MWIPSSSHIPGALFPTYFPTLFVFPSPILCEVSVVIYPSPPFIFLLHLLVIHAHTWVHVPSPAISVALWATVAPIAPSRGHIHINGVRGPFSTMLLCLTYWAQDLLWDPRGDCLWQCGAFLFCDFGLPRTGLSSVVYPGSLDSLHSSSSNSSFSAWALSLIRDRPKSLDLLAPQ